MTSVELSVIFMLGLVSSLHCVQMCGPIVLAYSLALGQTSSKHRTMLLGHLAYNCGRILTYSALGAMAGLLGQAVGLVGKITGFTSLLALVGGTVMLVAGILMTGVLPGPNRFGAKLLQISSTFLRPVSRLIVSVRLPHRFLLGLSLGFLPCGLVYAALLRALATGSSWQGACTMAAFGAGTTAALLLVGMFSSALSGVCRRVGRHLAAAGVIAMGAVLIIRGTLPQVLQGAHAAHVCH